MKRKNCISLGGGASASTIMTQLGVGIRDVGKRTSSNPFPMYGLVAILAILCYLNGLNGDFVHDDIPAVTLNKDVIAINHITNSFRNDFWGTPMAEPASHKSYRPLTILTFRMNFLCFGLQPLWFHATNIALHSAASVLFTRTTLSVAGMKPSFATLAGLLFALHPIHTEAVTGIVGRADVLACIFFLLSLLAYHGGHDRQRRVWTSIAFGGMAMLAKETGVSVIVVNVLFDVYRHGAAIRRAIVDGRWGTEIQQFANRTGKLLASLGILLAVRIALLQGSLPKFSQQDNPTAFHPSIQVRLMTYCYLTSFNWWLLLNPATLSHDWQMGSIPLITSINDWRNLMTCLFFVLCLLLGMRSLADFESQKQMPVVLGLLLLILPFLPATNLVVTVGFVVAERILYIPSMGFTLIIVYGIQVLWNTCLKYRQTIACCIMILLTASCLRTIIRNRDWRSRDSLLRAGLMTLPHNAKMHYNYANFLRDSARPELAKSHYVRALDLWPTYASAHNNLGTLLSDEQEAEGHFLAAIRYSAEHVNAHYNLGQLYRRWNRSVESEHMLKRCISLEPRFTPAYMELARLRGPKDRTVSGLLRTAAELNPDDPYYSTTYGHWLLDKGNPIAAISYYWRALGISATHQEAMIGAATILRKIGQHSRLLQIITRWHSALRISRGEAPLSPHLYLQGWKLKTELRHKAKVYENCSSYRLDKEKNYVVTTGASNFSNRDSDESMHSIKRVRNWLLKHCKAQAAQGTSSPMVVHHFLD